MRPETFCLFTIKSVTALNILSIYTHEKPFLRISHICSLRFGVYVPLCCFHQEGRAQQAPTDCSFSEQDGTDSSLQRPKDFLALVRENLREQFFSPTHVPAHTCPPSPELIRSEVEELKSDFNRRIKEVLFNSLFSAYYVAFLPLCFVQVRLIHKRTL